MDEPAAERAKITSDGREGLYIRRRETVELRAPVQHLERMLWSWNAGFNLRWTVSYGLPGLDPSKRADRAEEPSSDEPSPRRFAVAFVDEDAVVDVADGVLTSALLDADRLIYVRRAGAPSGRPVPCHEPTCVEVQRPFSFESFCNLCATLLRVSLKPSPERFDYHSWDVLQDIWAECETPSTVVAEAQLERYTLAEALSASRSEAIVLTRRTPPFRVLYANAPFWKAVGWPDTMTGRPLSFLQGALTHKNTLASLHDTVNSTEMQLHGNGEWSGRVINYTSLGAPFLNSLSITACVDAGVFVGVVRVTAIGVTSIPAAIRAKPPVCALPRAATRREREQPRDDCGGGSAQLALVVFRTAAPHEIVFASTTGCAHSSHETRSVVGKPLRAALGEPHAASLVDALAAARAGGREGATIDFELRARSAEGAELVCNATLVGDSYVVARLLPAKPAAPESAPEAWPAAELPAPQRQRLCA